jgi:hypothetical protein
MLVAMPSYLVERYVGAADVEAASSRFSAGRVRHVGTMYVPEDETCFDLFEAPSRELLREALQAAAIVYERIVEAISPRRL